MPKSLPHSPLPQPLADLMKEQINPYYEPVPEVDRPNTNRAYDVRRDDDNVRETYLGFEIIDEVVIDYVEKHMKPQLFINGDVVNVPIIMGVGERWKSIQHDGYLRDKHGKIQTPLVVLKRTNIEKRRDLGNKLDANNPHLVYTFEKKYTNRNQYDNFSILNNRIPQKEYHTVVVPDYVKINYECMLWTDSISHMNKLIELFNYHSDSYWGRDNEWKFLSLIDNYNNVTELNVGEDRIVKTNFTLKLQGYILTDSVSKYLKSQSSKRFSRSQLVFTTEIEGDGTESTILQNGASSTYDPTLTKPSTGGSAAANTALITYLTTSNIKTANSALNTVNTATFENTSLLTAPASSNYITGIGDFFYYINGLNIPATSDYITSISNSGNNVEVVFNTNTLGYTLDTEDEVLIAGKINI